MMQVAADNLALVAIAVVVLLLLVVWTCTASRRTRITRDPSAEVGEAKRNQALIDSAPVAAVEATPDAPESDLSSLKGVGPKLIAQLHELGVTSLAQIAAWDAAEIARIDAQLGRFAGRIERDDWVGQARLLQSGDQSAYEDRFGKL